MNEPGGAEADRYVALGGNEIDREIARLLEPGLRANAWRPDFDAFRHRRLWDECQHGRRLHRLQREWHDLDGQAVLDLGTGRGGMAVALSRQGYRVIALDLRLSSARVTRLRGLRYGLDVPAVQARVEQLPFRGESVGAVVCRDVMEHCELPAQLLAEIWRVLCWGGSCFLTVINRLCWVDPHYHLTGISFLPRALAERYIGMLGRSKDSTEDRQRLSDLHYYRYGEVVRWAIGFGFAVRDLEAERLYRRRADGLASSWRWVRYRLLRSLSLQAPHFELLLCKRRTAGRARRAA